MTFSDKWLLLLYGLPTKKGATRVHLWRQLKKCGALPLKTSAYLLPDKAEHHERLQWMAQQVRDGGGEATIIHVTEIEGLGSEDIVRQFNEIRAADYAALLVALNELIAQSKKRFKEAFAADLEKLTRQFEDIRKIDFFDCPRAQDAQMLLKRAASLGNANPKISPPLAAKRFLGKAWLTRPRPEIDRVGSAWLIRKFIDPKAGFIFNTDPAKHRDAIPYDMFEVEFSHHGDDCTFETLVKRFGIADKTVLKIAGMVHDADLEDGKFQTIECVGIDRVLKGWAKIGLSDEEILSRGSECFEALYQQLVK
ncbi:MAG TPA: chromate resistance protein ChrB domain-containing protein [Verrucomicrobiae bacterium]|nr:chromate resistance protein ChrB domain-containing protein [Verrucomicrobiae bacterium]